MSRFVMGGCLIALATLGGSLACGQTVNVVQPGDAIVLHNGNNDADPDAGPPPFDETVEHAIDLNTWKYLNFLDLGSGFIVTPTLGSSIAGTIVTGLRFYTANDGPERDPSSYLLEGSVDGPNGSFTVISGGALELPIGRNPAGQPINFAMHFNQLVTFTNTAAYTSYRVTFPTLRDATAANSMQIAEVELLGVAPEPPSITTQPQDQMPVGGNNATFTVVASGTPPLRYQWRLNGFSIAGATDATYSLSQPQPIQSGSYSVVVANDHGEVLSQSATLVVGDVPSLSGSDSFYGGVDLFFDLPVLRGDNTGASGEPGEPRHAKKLGGSSVWYTWTAWADGIATFSTRGSTFDTLLAVYTGNILTNLVTVTADEDSGGFYTSRVQFNAVGGTTYHIAVDGFAGAQGPYILSSDFFVTAETVPMISGPPLSLGVQIGNSATFSVVASGPELHYQWFFLGAVIPGATGPTLTISNPQPANVGYYTVEIENSFGRPVESPRAYLMLTTETRLACADKFEDFLESLLLPEPQVASMLSTGSVIMQFVTTQGAGPEAPIGCSIPGNTMWHSIGRVNENTVICLEAHGTTVKPKLQAGTYLGGAYTQIPGACDGRSASTPELAACIAFAATAGRTYGYQINSPSGDSMRVSIRVGTKLSITNTPGVTRMVRLTWCAPTNYYVLQTTNGLLSPPSHIAWANLGGVHVNQFQHTVDLPANGPRQFFRLKR